MIQISRETVACFIERNSSIKYIDKYMIDEWIKMVTKNTIGKPGGYENYVQIEVVSESANEERVWVAVQKCDHIWCQSFFIGDSARLCYKMLTMAEYFGVKNKLFFNLADRMEAMHYLLTSNRQDGRSIRWLETHHNVKFYFYEEIAAMMNDYKKLEVC